MTLYSVPQAAERLGIDHHSLANRLRRNGWPKVGGRYILTDDDIEKLKDGKAGRPKRAQV
jgi:hypothetical protein